MFLKFRSRSSVFKGAAARSLEIQMNGFGKRLGLEESAGQGVLCRRLTDTLMDLIRLHHGWGAKLPSFLSLSISSVRAPVWQQSGLIVAVSRLGSRLWMRLAELSWLKLATCQCANALFTRRASGCGRRTESSRSLPYLNFSACTAQLISLFMATSRSLQITTWRPVLLFRDYNTANWKAWACNYVG